MSVPRPTSPPLAAPRRAPPERARTSHGERTHQAILDFAVDLASKEGLEALTVGRLATAVSMSKAGLFAHFGSKEELQLATVDAARAIFLQQVVAPTLTAKDGLPRLRALCESWISYVERQVFAGGCFFSAVAAEFDGRPGPVRDRIAAMNKEWHEGVKALITTARDAGELSARVDAAQLAFELNALEHEANFVFQLHGDRRAFDRARVGMNARLSNEAAAGTGKKAARAVKRTRAR